MQPGAKSQSVNQHGTLGAGRTLTRGLLWVKGNVTLIKLHKGVLKEDKKKTMTTSGKRYRAALLPKHRHR